MAPKSQTWGGRESQPQYMEPENRRSSTFVRIFQFPVELKNVANKVYQPINGLFRRKSKTSRRSSTPTSTPTTNINTAEEVTAPPTRTQSCHCSEPLEEEVLLPVLSTDAGTDMSPQITGAGEGGSGVWPPIVHSTEAPLTRYTSFPEPRFSGDTRRRSWVFAVVRTAKQKVAGLLGGDAAAEKELERDLLRRKPVVRRERERFRAKTKGSMDMVIRVDTMIERHSDGPPRLPELDLMGDGEKRMDSFAAREVSVVGGESER